MANLRLSEPMTDSSQPSTLVQPPLPVVGREKCFVGHTFLLMKPAPTISLLAFRRAYFSVSFISLQGWGRHDVMRALRSSMPAVHRFLFLRLSCFSANTGGADLTCSSLAILEGLGLLLRGTYRYILIAAIFRCHRTCERKYVAGTEGSD